jgi:osomolarity two-component system sensor histidine kinase TcsA
MSHEIRTPMNGVTSAATLLSQTNLNFEQYDLMTIILQSSGVLMKVINDILDFTKMESNEVKLFDERFDLYKEVHKITHEYEIRPNATVKLSTFIDPNVPPYVQGDPFRYRQILTNLLDNAVKYTEEGSIRVVISARFDERKETVVVQTEVIDTGPGIPEDDRGKLFQPFQQTDSTSRKRFKGTGLGLCICKYLTDLMKGHIRAESNESGGSTFLFTVVFVVTNATQVHKAFRQKISRELPPANPEAWILVVDDNLINVNLAVRILKKLGYNNVDAVYNGQTAVEKAAEKKYAVILMDLEMPVKGGLQATKEIRERNDPVAIIAMTANAMEGDADKCLSAGMNDYLQKPVDFSLLSAALNRWLSH